MARKTKKQQAETQQVADRVSQEAANWLRLDTAVVKAGKAGTESGRTKRLSSMHPSVEGMTQALEDQTARTGRVTTNSGLSVDYTRSKGSGFSPHGQGLAPQQGKTPLSPVEEGVSQKFRQRISPNYGPDAAARFAAEAEKIAARPNPLRSDGLVDAVMAAHPDSMGGNKFSQNPGSISALARGSFPQSKIPTSTLQSRPDVGPGHGALSKSPVFSSGRDLALHSIGWNEGAQQAAFDVIKERVRSSAPDLSPADVYARAHGQLQEHLDEALHGSRSVGHEDAQIRDIVGTEGMSVQTGAASSTVRPRATSSKRGPGMTSSTTPEGRAQRGAMRALRKGGQWQALKGTTEATVSETSIKEDENGEPVQDDYGRLVKVTKKVTKQVPNAEAAAQNHLDQLTAEQKARRARGIAPEDMNTMAPGANPEQKSESLAQPTFSTSTRVGVPHRSSRESVIQSPGSRVAGEISPVPPNLPTEPVKTLTPMDTPVFSTAGMKAAKAQSPRLGQQQPSSDSLSEINVRVGRTRGERGMTNIRDTRKSMRGGLAPKARDYGSDIARYQASRSQVQPRGTRTAVPKKETQMGSAAPAQTEIGPFGTAGMEAARAQNITLGQRAPRGQRSRFKVVS